MSKIQSNSYQHSADPEETINIKDILDKLISSWHWLAVFTFVGLLTSFIYIKYTSPLYQITAKLLVNDDEKGGNIGKQASALMDLGGLMGGKSSVDNEVEILKTRFLMEQVVRDMELNITYSNKSQLMTQEVYQSPIKLLINKGLDTILNTNLEITKISHSKIKVKGKKFEKDVSWGTDFFCEKYWDYIVLPTDKRFTGKSISINVCSIDERVSVLSKQLSVGVANKQVSIIDLGLISSLPKKGEDILNKLIYQYIVTNLGDKNSIADSTGKFIKQRINAIASELGDVENDVESFKKRNQLSDMSEQGKVLVQNTGEFANQLAKAESQVEILNDLEKYMLDASKNKRVFPTSVLPQDMVFSDLMNQYNALLLERDRQLLSLTVESPVIKNIDNQIQETRSGILSNIRSTKKFLHYNKG